MRGNPREGIQERKRLQVGRMVNSQREEVGELERKRERNLERDGAVSRERTKI